ncbi:hypothetical protein GCM10022286_05550 [Gryllotalpicola daejeonensis]|uniref:Uncharacterized protein n=1 Tax=Gryllotalpicola daejeonensis TaxID=993087 RepID=A0ABP7ZFA4_9MICO
MAFQDTLTNREIEDIEDLLEVPFTKIADSNVSVGRMNAAFAWIAQRREDPSFTYEQARDLPAAFTNSLLSDDEGSDEDPKG